VRTDDGTRGPIASKRPETALVNKSRMLRRRHYNRFVGARADVQSAQLNGKQKEDAARG
jgi:hypothetical protein